MKCNLSRFGPGGRPTRSIAGDYAMRCQVDEQGSQRLKYHGAGSCPQERRGDIEDRFGGQCFEVAGVVEHKTEEFVGAGESEDEEGTNASGNECPQSNRCQRFPGSRECVHGIAQHLPKRAWVYLHRVGTVTGPALETCLPELPEVETTRRHLETAMSGRTLTKIAVNHDRTVRHNASKEEVVARLSGRKVDTVGRHGKFLVVGLDHGYTMIAHLGMSGRFSVASPSEEVVKHTHFVAGLDNGSEIRFIDPRTFGFIAAYDEDELSSSGLARLGPDAWTAPPGVAELSSSLAGRSAPIKALLLDQGPLAGLGNIYADEALHLGRIHPLTPGGELSDEQLLTLLDSVQVVLETAIDTGGTTLGDLAYLLPDGQAGDNLRSLHVYGREAEPCHSCGTPIERVAVRARSTHFCPECQSRA